MMTRNDFEIIVKVLNRSYQRGYGTWNTYALASELGDEFKAINPRFDMTRFIIASTREKDGNNN